MAHFTSCASVVVHIWFMCDKYVVQAVVSICSRIADQMIKSLRLKINFVSCKWVQCDLGQHWISLFFENWNVLSMLRNYRIWEFYCQADTQRHWLTCFATNEYVVSNLFSALFKIKPVVAVCGSHSAPLIGKTSTPLLRCFQPSFRSHCGLTMSLYFCKS